MTTLAITRGRQSYDSCLPATGRGCIAWFAWIISVSERCAKHEQIDSVRIAKKQAPSFVFAIEIVIAIEIEIAIAANGRLTAISSKSGASHESIASHALLLSISIAISIAISSQ